MNYFQKAKENAPTPEERLRQQVEALSAEIEMLREENAALREEIACLKPPAHSIEAPQANLSPNMIGHSIGNKGIYFGPWEPKDRNGQSLGKTFYVFAAPKDLHDPDPKGSGCRTFSEAAREVGALKGWHGHDGIYCENDTALYAALKDGSALGKWFIPTLALLRGRDIDGKVVRDNHLYGLKNEGALKGTFTTEDDAPSPKYPDWYWSCTEHRVDSAEAWTVRFLDCDIDCDDKDTHHLSCRPVRVELAPPPAPTL